LPSKSATISASKVKAVAAASTPSKLLRMLSKDKESMAPICLGEEVVELIVDPDTIQVRTFLQIPEIYLTTWFNVKVVKDQLGDDPGDANGGRLPDVVAETTMLADPMEEVQRKDESYRAMAIQVFIPFLVAGLGMVGAGLVLDLVQVKTSLTWPKSSTKIEIQTQHWSVFMEVKELLILVPALLGLKGNLEMTLASRLSTQANLGHMDTPKEQWSMIAANLTLIQVQNTTSEMCKGCSF
jgi:hypothetical protein